MSRTNEQIEQDNALQANSLDHARQLVQLLETGRVNEANQVLNDLCSLRENELYRDIGKLTRDLHDTIKSFNEDDRLQMLMNEEMPDARKRLDYVIKTTEKSAHQTMSAIENCGPLVDSLAMRAAELHSQLQELNHGTMLDENYHSVTAETETFLHSVANDTKQIRGSMNDVLMAQEFQDITGQIIQRVIRMVHELEQSLVDMLRIFSQRLDGESRQPGQQHDEINGPAIPDVTRGDVMQNQDDVDDLLSTLGF